MRRIVGHIRTDRTRPRHGEFAAIDVVEIAEDEYRTFGIGEIQKLPGGKREQAALLRRLTFRRGLTRAAMGQDRGENCRAEKY